MNARDVRSLASLYVVWDIWVCPYHEERFLWGTKMCICLQGTPYSESLKSWGTKWGVRFP